MESYKPPGIRGEEPSASRTEQELEAYLLIGLLSLGTALIETYYRQ